MLFTIKFHQCFVYKVFSHVFTKSSPMFFFHPCSLQSSRENPCLFYFHHNIFIFPYVFRVSTTTSSVLPEFYNNILSFCLSFYELSVFAYTVFKTTFSVIIQIFTNHPYLTFLLALEPATQCSSGKINNVSTNTTHR